jgi:hypothetical protein
MVDVHRVLRFTKQYRQREKAPTVRILLTGNMGYVGPIVLQHLRRQHPNAYLVGFDAGLFAHCLTTSTFPEVILNEQRFGDVRDITSSDLAGFAAIVHLTAVSTATNLRR